MHLYCFAFCGFQSNKRGIVTPLIYIWAKPHALTPGIRDPRPLTHFLQFTQEFDTALSSLREVRHSSLWCAGKHTAVHTRFRASRCETHWLIKDFLDIPPYELWQRCKGSEMLLSSGGFKGSNTEHLKTEDGVSGRLKKETNPSNVIRILKASFEWWLDRDLSVWSHGPYRQIYLKCH